MGTTGHEVQVARQRHDDPALVCPHCAGALEGDDRLVTCRGCGTPFAATATGVPDLRLRRPKQVVAPFELGVPTLPEERVPVRRLARRSDDPVTATFPAHVSDGMAHHLPAAPRPDARALDVGCGDGAMAPVLRARGYRYAGIDLLDESAPLLADVHAIPFADATFDLVWCGSVLQYTAYPVLAVREIARVLVPGGAFVGSIAFLEAYDGDNRTAFTHDGVVALLDQAGLRVHGVYADQWWTALTAIGTAGLFPHAPTAVVRTLTRPLEIASRAWWSLARRQRANLSPERRVAKTTAMYAFVAEKPAPEKPVPEQG